MELEIDRYRIDRLIGQGAMGKIYLAQDPKLNRRVAIKMLNADHANEETKERFRLEARSIAALKHPNIVELYDFSGADADELFLVLEFVQGPNLHQMVSERGAMNEATALCVAHELCLALSHAHQQGVVHRDLKPENVLLSEGRIVLMDFGIVKEVAATGSDRSRFNHSTRVMGTPGFMSPEQFEGRGIGPHTDIHALGAVLYDLLTGDAPFYAENIRDLAKRTQKGNYEDPRSYNPMLSEACCNLIAKCLEPKPSKRFASAEAVREEILALLKTHGVTEIRKEIVNYEQNPSTYALDQREQGLDVLMRDLNLAIGERDLRRVQALVSRIKTVAPLKHDLHRVDGIKIDRKGVRFVEKRRRGGFWARFLAFSFGTALGGFAVLALLVTGYLPTQWVAWMEKLLLLLEQGQP